MRKCGFFLSGVAGLLCLCGAGHAQDMTPFVWVWVCPDASVSYEVWVLNEPSAAAYAKVEDAFGPPEYKTPPSEDDPTWTIGGSCPGVARRELFMVKGSVPMGPLLELAGRSAEGEVEVSFRWQNAAVHNVPLLESEGSADWNWSSAGTTLGPGEDLPVLQFEVGFPLWRVALYPFACIGLVAACVGFFAWRRRVALRLAETDPAAGWFSYVSSSQMMWLGGLAAVVCPSLLLDPGSFLGFAAGVDWPLVQSGVGLALVLVPLLAVLAMTSAVSHPVYVKVRRAQITRGDLALQGLLAGMMWAAPLCLLLTGVNALAIEMPFRAALLLGGAPASYFFIRSLWWKTFRVRRERLTECSLSAGINSLAEKAGMRLKELQILTPGARLFSANAFAMEGAKMVLTDCLVEQLTTREVDAIAAHEMAHTKRKDPERKTRLAIFMGVFYGLFFSLGLGQYLLPVAPFAGALPWQLVSFLGIGLCVLLWLFVSRRFEYKADAGAVALTGDPEAFITGLTNVYRVNLMPLQWSRWRDLLLTHPSLMRRAEAVAKRAGIGTAALHALIERGHTGDSYYAIPPYVLDQGKVFSTQVRHTIQLWGVLMLLGLCGLTPALVAWIVAQSDPQGPARAAVYLAGLVLTPAVMMYASGFVAQKGWRALKDRLQAKLEREGIDLRDSNAQFVSFAPDDSENAYEGFYNTDVGFVFTADDRLCYVGDELRFALSRDDVADVERGRPLRGWYRRRRVVIRWRDADGAAREICLSVYGVSHSSKTEKANGRLFDFIKAWQRGNDASAAEVGGFADLGLPQDFTATGAPLQFGCWAIVKSGRVPVFLAVLFSLSLGLIRPGESVWPVLYATAGALMSHVIFHLPFRRRRREKTG